MECGEKLKTYVLFGFQESGRGNIICVTQAQDDRAAAEKLGGRLVDPPQMDIEAMMAYSFRLPPSPSGVSWSQFHFVSGQGIENIAAREPTGKWVNSVRNVAPHSAHLVLAEVLFFE